MADETVSNTDQNDATGLDALNSDSTWTTCKSLLRSQVSEAVWLTSFRDLHIVAMSTERVVLVAPSGVIRDRVLNRYLPMVQAALADAGCETDVIDIEVQPELHASVGVAEAPQIRQEPPSAPDLQDRLDSSTQIESHRSPELRDSYTDTIHPFFTF